MNIIDEYILFEGKEDGDIPSDLNDFLNQKKTEKYLNDIGTDYKKRKSSHKDMLDSTKTHDMFSVKSERLIKKFKLLWISSYYNGDIALYSPVNQKVYDWGHESDWGFYDLTPSKHKSRLWKPQPYTQWIRDVSSGDHDGAWI